jgi:hypothetical protein
MNTIAIGSTVTYLCPWDGTLETGTVIPPTGPVLYVGYYDIERSDGCVDHGIPRKDINKLSS